MRLARQTRQSRPSRSLHRASAGGGGPAAPIGESWTQRAVSTHAASVREIGQVHEATDGRIVATSYDRSFVSTDGGDTFTEYTESGLTGYLAYSPTLNRFVAWKYSTGLWYSTDGITWTQSSLTSLIPGGVVWAPWASKFIALRYGTTETSYWSADGITWEAPQVSGIRSQDRIYTAPDHVIASCDPSDFQRRCALQGTWTTITTSNIKFDAVWAGSYGWRTIVYRTASQLLYGSTDGTAFTNLGALLPSSAVWHGIQFDPDTERLFLWGAPGAYYSDDGGSTWTAATGTVPVDDAPNYLTQNGGFCPIAGKVFAGGAALYSSP